MLVISGGIPGILGVVQPEYVHQQSGSRGEYVGVKSEKFPSDMPFVEIFGTPGAIASHAAWASVSPGRIEAIVQGVGKFIRLADTTGSE
jgi:hypothetical protein